MGGKSVSSVMHMSQSVVPKSRIVMVWIAAVTTPLKLVQLVRDQQVSLNDCRHVVLDEADKLLDMG